MQKGQILIWIIVGALVIAFAGGAYYLGRSSTSPVVTSQTPQPTPVSTPDETANWKTYTSTKYGLNVKYPPDWKLSEGSVDNLVMFLGDNQEDHMQIHLYARLNSTLDDLSKELTKQGIAYKQILIKTGNKDSVQGIEYQSPFGTGDAFWKSFTIGNNTYELMITTLDGEPQKQESILNKMLSTFNFL